MVNGVPKTVKVPSTNEVKILMSDGTLMKGKPFKQQRKNEDDRLSKKKLEKVS